MIKKFAAFFDSKIVEVDIELLISNENFVSPYIMKDYLKVIGSTITTNINSIKLSKVSLRINYEDTMSYPHSTLHSIEYEINSNSGKASVTYVNNRSIIDNF